MTSEAEQWRSRYEQVKAERDTLREDIRLMDNLADQQRAEVRRLAEDAWHNGEELDPERVLRALGVRTFTGSTDE